MRSLRMGDETAGRVAEHMAAVELDAVIESILKEGE